MKHWGIDLKINVSKTNIVVFDRKNWVSDYKFFINDEKLHQVDQFIYFARTSTKNRKMVGKKGETLVER